MAIDDLAARGFEAGAAAYELARPGYPTEAVDVLVTHLGLGAGTRVCDLAAGTGKLTRLLVPLVDRVIAVEPSGPMRAELCRQLPSVDALAGTAEAIPLADASVDAVFVAEAFHWFRSAEASAEIARVLSPGAGLSVLWNRSRWSEQEHLWLEEFDALNEALRQAAGPFPAAGEDRWRLGLREGRLFAPLSHTEVDHFHRVSVDEFVALVASWSWIVNLPDQERMAVLDKVRGMVGLEPELTLLYRTEIHWTRLA